MQKKQFGLRPKISQLIPKYYITNNVKIEFAIKTIKSFRTKNNIRLFHNSYKTKMLLAILCKISEVFFTTDTVIYYIVALIYLCQYRKLMISNNYFSTLCQYNAQIRTLLNGLHKITLQNKNVKPTKEIAKAKTN